MVKISVWRENLLACYGVLRGRHLGVFDVTSLLHDGDTGEHVTADKLTLEKWVTLWVAAGCPGNRKRTSVSQRSIERYHELLNHHVLKAVVKIGSSPLGDRPLQKLQSTEIDALYVQLEENPNVAPRSARHVHSVFNACLGAARRAKKIRRNLMEDVMKVPYAGESDHGLALDENEMRVLVEGFRGSSLHGIVGTGIGVGARRNEIVGLFVADYDPANKKLSIKRTVEETKKYGLRYKAPKTARGKRTFEIDDAICALFDREIEKLKRIAAGVPDRAEVDLSLVKLPPDALMFPKPPGPGEDFDFTRLRDPRNTSKAFKLKATKLGFPKLRFHDLRGSYSTWMLDNDKAPLHVVAARIGDDPVTLMRSYAKLTKRADKAAATASGSLLQGMFR